MKGGFLIERGGGLFNLVKRIYRLSISSSQDQELVGHLPIELPFLLCKFLSCEGCSLEFSPAGARFLEDGLVVPGRYTAFANNQKMVSILHKELERKVVEHKHMKLEVMQPKIKNNLNFQHVNKPYRISLHEYSLSFIINSVVNKKGEGRGRA